MTMAGWNRSALIVEDQPFVGLVASDILREAGFDAFHAFDAAEALAVLRSHPEIRLMITEADLPGPVDGVELAHAIAGERPGIQIVVTASSGTTGSDLPVGARVLRKPFSSRDLRLLVCAMTLLQDA